MLTPKDCEDNNDKNCNQNEQVTGKISQKNDYKIENSDSADGGDDNGNNGNGGSAGFNTNTLSCSNNMNNPNTGQNGFGQQGP